MRRILIENLKNKPVNKQTVVMAEHKGLGHPDSIMDGVCEAASQALSKYYLKHFKTVLHHNVDKGLLVAGESKPKFKGGKVSKTIQIHVAGRATAKVGKKKINVKKIVENAAKNYLKQFRHLKPNQYSIYADIREGSANLKEVFKKGKKIPVANDTSFGVAHAPLCKTEQLALDVGNYLNNKLKIKYKAVGEDIKVMAWREGKETKLALAIAFVDKHIKSMEHYIFIKEKIKSNVKKFTQMSKKNSSVSSIEINTLDNAKGNESTIYLTTTGLSAEQGDDGQVGRGNRPSQLITPNRPMSLEACAGKNINHPGKLYQVLAQILANKIAKLNGVEECYVKLLTQIGKPLSEPLVSVELIGTDFTNNKKKANVIINNTLNKLTKIQKEIAHGNYRSF